MKLSSLQEQVNILKKILAFLIFFSFSLTAFSGDYTPYNSAAKKFHKTSGFSSQTEGMEFKGKKIFFWKPITETYESILNKKKWNKNSFFCQSFLQQSLPATTDNSCIEALKAANNKFKCLEVEFPEQLFRNQSLKSYNGSQLETMKGFLQMSIGPILTLDFPSYMYTEKNYYHFRTAMWRLYNKELVNKITNLQVAIKKVSVSKCFQNQQVEANLIFQKRLNDLQTMKLEIVASIKEAKKINQENFAKLKNAGFCVRQSSRDSTLTRKDKAVLSGIAGALAWRMRGNGIWQKKSSNQQRSDFAGKAFEMIALFNDEDSPGLAKKIGNAMLARSRKGWGEYYDIGTAYGVPDKDLDAMTERGAYQVGESEDLIASSPMEILKKSDFENSALHVGGLQMGICYLVPQYSFRTKASFYGQDWRDPLVAFIDSPLSYGELCSGAAFGIGLSYSITRGPRCDSKKNVLLDIIKTPADISRKIIKKADELIDDSTRTKQPHTNDPNEKK